MLSPSLPPHPPTLGMQLLHEQAPSPSGLQTPSGFSLEHLAALINHVRGLSPTLGGSPSGVVGPGSPGQLPSPSGGGVISPSAGGDQGPIGSPSGSPTSQPGTYPPAPAVSPSGALPGSPSAPAVPAAPYAPSSGSPTQGGPPPGYGFMHPAGPIDPNQLAALRALHGPGGFSNGPGAMQHRLGNDARAAQLWEARHPDALSSGRFIPGWMRAYLAQHSANNAAQAQ